MGRPRWACPLSQKRQQKGYKKTMSANVYQKRIQSLRDQMRAEGMDAYLILTDDFHASEYVGDFFKCREYLSGFDGSAGTLLVTLKEALLWTDGRYFLQAADQLEGTGIALMKMGEKGVPSVSAWLASSLKEGDVLGFDGRTVGCAYGENLEKALSSKGIVLKGDLDLVGRIWEDRPPLPERPAWILDEKYAGCSVSGKLAALRAHMEKGGADACLAAALDETGWLFNLRGDDIDFNPVPLAYALVFMDRAVLYMAPGALKAEDRAFYEGLGITIRPYLEIFGDLKALEAGTRLMLDRETCSMALRGALPGDVQVLSAGRFIQKQKGIKNETEMQGERTAHIQDAAAVIGILAWLDEVRDSEDFKAGRITELTVAEKLLALRKARPDFVGESFAPIIASGPHGAIVHYEPTKETDIPIQDNTFLLMDTGGHYLQGTTDITRTVVMGTPTRKMQEYYTAVLRGHLDLGSAVFKRGTNGYRLDLLARMPLWKLGLDFNHGTGHGVGFLMNVHEGPQRISSAPNDVAFEPGMLTSDEPGVYLTGEFGIRIENLMLCREAFTGPMGDFLRFEMITMVPYDRRAILPELLTDEELSALNDYHRQVIGNVSHLLSEKERAWLMKAAAPITRD